MKFPENLKYTKDHEWAKVDGSLVTIGITDHAQNSLGDIVYLDLPKVGKELKSHEVFGVVESIKAVSDLYSPVTGKVVEVNSALVENPSQINSDPYENSWMIKVEVSGAIDSGLMDMTSYKTLVDSL